MFERISPTTILIAAAAAAALTLAGLYTALHAASSEAQALAKFDTIASVMQHPRCLNCHRSDMPRVRDDARPHVPRVRPGTDGRGVGGEQCWICHRDENNPISNIPGVEDWRMPPFLMSWDGLEPRDMCDNIKDRKMNGDRDLAALEKHFLEDHLIAWAWAPGPHLSTPPVSYETFKTLVRDWIAAGAPCPP